MSDTEINKDVLDEREQHQDPDYEEIYIRKPRKPSKPRQKFSNVWKKFTVLNAKEYLAQCNICHSRMSYRSTSTNLKKHLISKHNYDSTTNSVILYKHKNKGKIITPSVKKPNLSELGGLEGLIMNVMGEEADPLTEQNDVEEHVVYTDENGHDYSVLQNAEVETQADQGAEKPQPTSRFQERNDRNKRNRIMDLQLECLEIKKYNMQMEALMLEHQLNLPRSIYTETLRRVDTMTRSTQTDVGGNNTKVFYVSDNRGLRESSQHFFSFQERLDDN